MKTLPFLLVAILAAGCGREEISVRRQAKEKSAPAAPATAMGEGEAPRPSASLHWTAPAGWIEEAGDGMRLASFKLPDSAKGAVVTVATFPGDVGGELANVNRWRGQLALPPVEETAVASLRGRAATGAGEALLYDFTGEGNSGMRLVAASLRVGDSTWFFKLMGPQAAVASAKPAFLKLLGSVRP